jgi:membrane glycosyltransferase
MLMGVFGYLASPIWLALILVGAAMAAQVASIELEYFPDRLTLFPQWPVFDSERMISLFVMTAVVLLLPKLLGLLWSMRVRAMRRRCVPMAVSAVVELVFSLLYAPLLMLIQTQQLWEILRGRDSGWAAQHRTHRALSWRQLCRRHLGHTIAGVSLATALFFVSTPLLAWMSPTLIGLVLAIPLSALSGNVALARGLGHLGLLKTPEEYAKPRLAQVRDEFERALRAEVGSIAFETLLEDDAKRRRHFDVVHAPAARLGRRPDMHRISVQMKIAEGGSAGEVIACLSDAERMALLSEPDVFESLLEPRSDSPAGAQPRNGAGADTGLHP